MNRLDNIYKEHLKKNPDQILLEFNSEKISYYEFNKKVGQTCEWLNRQKFAKGDRLAVWMDNSPNWLYLLFAASRIGVVLVSVNTRYGLGELKYLLHKSGAKCLLVDDNIARKNDILSAKSKEALEILDILENIVVYDITGRDVVRDSGSRSNGISVERFVLPKEVAGECDYDSSNPLIIFTTSGTTRGPKLVVHTSESIWQHANGTHDAFFVGDDSCLMSMLPLCGVYGLNSTLAVIAGGGRIILEVRFSTTKACELLKSGEITHFFGSDEMFYRIDDTIADVVTLPNIKLMGVGLFSGLNAERLDRLKQRGWPVVGLYGSSEVQALYSVADVQAEFWSRIRGGGKCAHKLSRVRARDVETGLICGWGREGELEFKSPTLFAGYYNDIAASQEAITEDGYFKSGDFGFAKNDREFVYEMRLGDTIRIAGYIVDPTEIEIAITDAVPDSSAGVVAVRVGREYKAVAFVSTKKEITEEAIKNALKDKIADFKIPYKIWMVGTLPISNTANSGSRVKRAPLRALAEERIEREHGQ